MTLDGRTRENCEHFSGVDGRNVFPVGIACEENEETN